MCAAAGSAAIDDATAEARSARRARGMGDSAIKSHAVRGRRAVSRGCAMSTETRVRITRRAPAGEGAAVGATLPPATCAAATPLPGHWHTPEKEFAGMFACGLSNLPWECTILATHP